MRRSLIITIILIAFIVPLMISCTQDASDGIFAQVVTQGSSAKYKIRQYIHYNSIKNKHYFLEEGGVYENARCIIPGSYTESFYDNGTIYLLASENKIISYDLVNHSKIKEFTGNFGDLTPNGFILERKNSKNTGLSKISGTDLKTYSSFTSLPGSVTNMLWAGDTVLLQTKSPNLEYFILIGEEFEKIENLKNLQVIGFQESTPNNYYVMTYDDNNYRYCKVETKVETSGTSITCETIGSASVPGYHVTQAPSYYDAKNKTVVFRCQDYYDEISISDNTVKTGIQGGFASNIHTNTMEVVSMVPLNDTEGNVIIAFYKYGLYKANIKNNPATAEISF